MISPTVATSSRMNPVVMPASLHPLDRPDVWRKLILLSGIILAVCFFPPRSRVWPSPASLFVLGLQQWSNPAVTIFDHFNGFCANVAGYLFGALMAAGAAARLFGRVKLNRACSSATYSLLIFLGFLGFLETWASEWYEVVNGVWLPFATGTIATLATLAYVVAASRLGPRAMVCYEFAGALAVVAWFCFSWSPDSYPASITLVASIGLLLGIIGEAHFVLRRSWLDTELLLVACLFGERKLTGSKAIA